MLLFFCNNFNLFAFKVYFPLRFPRATNLTVWEEWFLAKKVLPLDDGSTSVKIELHASTSSYLILQSNVYYNGPICWDGKHLSPICTSFYLSRNSVGFKPRLGKTKHWSYILKGVKLTLSLLSMLNNWANTFVCFIVSEVGWLPPYCWTWGSSWVGYKRKQKRKQHDHNLGSTIFQSPSGHGLLHIFQAKWSLVDSEAMQ